MSDAEKRVVIKSPSHPWHGYSGTLSVDKGPLGMLIVVLDNGMRCCADKEEVQYA